MSLHEDVASRLGQLRERRLPRSPRIAQGTGDSILAIRLSHSFSARCSLKPSSSLLVQRRQRAMVESLALVFLLRSMAE